MAFYDIGDRIREARRRAGYSQEELAEMARLNRVTVAKYEAGKVEPGAQALSRIADALEVTVDALLGREPAETKTAAGPHTREARIISGGIDKLPSEQREQALNVVRALFSQYSNLFTSEGNDTDDT